MNGNPLREGRERKTMDLNEEIAKLAYDLYEKSGWIMGRDLENWLAAEKMITERMAEGPLSGRVKAIEVTAVVAVEDATKLKAEKGSESPVSSRKSGEKVKTVS